MYILDKTRARQVLLAQNMKPRQIDSILRRFPSLPDKLGPSIDKWLKDQQIPDIEVDGISVRQVMENHNSHFLVALADLAVLLDPDLLPEKREQWHRILRRRVMYE